MTPLQFFFFFLELQAPNSMGRKKTENSFLAVSGFFGSVAKKQPLFFNRKERKIKKVEAKTQRIDLRTTEKFSQAVEQSSNHETDHMRLAGFQNCCGLVTPVCLLLHPF